MEVRAIAIVLLLLLTLRVANSTCIKKQVTSCISLPSNPTCLGASLSSVSGFTHTSTVFANDSLTLDEVTEKLKLWSGLKAAPKCWEVIQPFLCSVYMPRCNSTDLTVERPSRELCLKTRTPCDIIRKISGWPFFLDCNQLDIFSANCTENSYEKKEISFDTTSRCNSPLVKTDNVKSWYSEVEGCGVQCQNPLFTEEEHEEVHIIIAVFGSLCLVCTLFTMLTFIIDWKTASRYPALILFFINACFFLGSIGWMAQFSGNARTDIVCKTDGTVRKGEPELGNGETASCTIVFILVYYFMMAGCVWFVMLAFAWYLTFRALGTQRDDLKNKTSYFHIASWCVPLVLTIVCLSVSEIDGDSLSGICFVGVFNNGYRGGFVLAPIGLMLVIGLGYLILVLKTLIKLKKESPDYISIKALSKIKETIIRLGIFTLLDFLFVVITFAVHVYIFVNEQSWSDSFKEYIYCQGNATAIQSVYNDSSVACELSSRPSVVAYGFHILAFFGAGITMSSWSWTKASLLAWERFLRKVFRKPSNRPVKLKKHKVIAKAFEKRKELNNGRLSISFASTHEDPLGMKFDLNSVSSNNSMSSDFRAAMPKLVKRRGGMMHPTAGTLRKYSDSDIGSVVSRMASRRHSIDSQISAAQGQFRVSDEEMEMEEVEYVKTRSNRNKAKKKKKIRKMKRNRILPVLGPISNAMSSAAYGGRRRHSRRGSGNSLSSRASAQGVDIDVEKKSLEAISITSYSHQNSLDAATLPEPPKHLGKMANFSIFTASAYMGELNAKLKDLESTDRSERESIRSWGDRKRRKTETGSVSGYVTSETEEPSTNGLVRLGSSRKLRHSRRSENGSRRHRSTSSHHDGTSKQEDSATESKKPVSTSRRQDSGKKHDKSTSTRHDSATKREDSASRRHDSAGRRQDSASRRYDSGSSRQNSGNGYMRSRDVTLEMAEMFYRQHRQASSATSRTSGRQGSARSARTSSAKSERSIIRQLPGETSAVEIENLHDPYASSN